MGEASSEIIMEAPNLTFELLPTVGECAGSLAGHFSARGQVATSLGNQRYCRRGGSRHPGRGGRRLAAGTGGTSPPSPQSCCAPCSHLRPTLGPAVPLGPQKTCTIDTSWRGSWTVREKGEKSLKCPLPWLQRGKDCLGGNAGFPLGGLSAEPAVPWPPQRQHLASIHQVSK